MFPLVHCKSNEDFKFGQITWHSGNNCSTFPFLHLEQGIYTLMEFFIIHSAEQGIYTLMEFFIIHSAEY